MARVFAYLPSFISQILDLIYYTVLIFIAGPREAHNHNLGSGQRTDF